MYDIIRYIKKHNKLDYKIATTLADLDAEIDDGQLSEHFDKRLEKIHKMQLKYINVCQIITEFLSQDEYLLHHKRVRLRILNILIAAIPTILSFGYIGIYKIISLLLVALIFVGDYIANKALSSIIDSKDETIDLIYEGVTMRNQQLEDLRNKYANFIGQEIRKIIAENNIDIDNDERASSKVINILSKKNIGGIEELTFFGTKKEDTPHNRDNNEYVFSTDDVVEEVHESESTHDKPKVKKKNKKRW